MRGWRITFAALFGALVAGCGSGLTTVEGTVTYKDQPLKEGAITFHPEKGRPASGKIKDGKIVEVTTETRNDGVKVGPAKVTISSIANAGDMYAKDHKSLIPEKYGDLLKTELKADIKSGKNDLKFELK